MSDEIDAGTQAIIEQTAFMVAEVVMKRFEEHQDMKLDIQLTSHIASCPAVITVNKWQNQSKALIGGILIGAAITGAGGVLGILKLFKWI